MVFAATWVAVLVVTFGASVYREIDGQTVRSVRAENVELTRELQRVSTRLDRTLANLSSTETERDRINVNLQDKTARHDQVSGQLERFKAFWPGAWLMVGIR